MSHIPNEHRDIAASFSLKVVSTDVGGICEVLPSDLIHLCEPSGIALMDKMKEVIDQVIVERATGAPSTVWDNHARVKMLYTWPNVAKRTEKVYLEAMKIPAMSDIDRLKT